MLRVSSKKEEEEKAEKTTSRNDRAYEKVLEENDLNLKNLESLINRASVDPLEKSKLHIPTYSLPQRKRSFLIVGDVHMNSTDKDGNLMCDFPKWKKVIKLAEDAGADYILQTGDVTDGENMRPWQKYYLNVQGLDRVVNYCANEWPESKLPTFFIAGNHDESYFNTAGADICSYIAAKRPDLHYLGLNEGDLPLQPEYQEMFFRGEKLPEKGVTWIRIRHPGDGSANGRSYKDQKHAQALVSRAKPNILVVGHYHKEGYLFERNTHVFSAGTMQIQSGWMRARNFQSHILGTLVTAYYHSDGTIAALNKQRLEYEVNGVEGFKSQLKWTRDERIWKQR